MAAGRKRKPDEAKILQGTFRADRSNPDAPVPAADPPVAPSWLPARGREIFRTLVARLQAECRASASHTEALSLLASALLDVEQCARVLAKGNSYRTRNSAGHPIRKPYPEVAIKRAAEASATRLIAEMGLTAASRGKVSATKIQKPGNGFGALS